MSSRIQSAPVKSRNAGTRISVVVRVRPPNQREIASAQGNVIHVLDDRVLIFDPPGERIQKAKCVQTSQSRAKNLHFGFDKVLSPENTQEDVFDVVKNSIFSEEGGLLDGFNCTVFAYGATGSGKTFSMAGTPENPGLMSRAVQYIYTSLEGMGRKAKLKLSYLEIYNERIRDLISPSEDNNKDLKLIEDPEKGIIVSGLSYCYPTNTDEVLQLISIGNSRRTQAQTDSNPVSSRSHAVCQIEVENCEDIPDIQSNHAIGKLSLIDLAGSERATTNTGIRLRESGKINCSLLALSNCINALCTQSTFIPFRQSKLTRLLKDSLGGNCKTVCLSCVSPSYLTYDDTYSTLQYANKTKNIRTNVTKNVLNVRAQVSQYPKIIAELKAYIQQLENQKGGNSLAESFAKSIEEPFNKEKQSILSLYNREMQNITGTDVKQQMMALQKMTNSDIKRKVTLKLSAFTTECIRKRPTQSNRAIDNEQKIKMLELENISLKGQLELYEKQISIQQNVIRSLSQKKLSQQFIPQRQYQPPSQMSIMPLCDSSAPKLNEVSDLIDLSDEPNDNRTENVDPNRNNNNNTLLSLFDETDSNSTKSYNPNQTKEFYIQPYQTHNLSTSISQNRTPNYIQNQSQSLVQNQQPSILQNQQQSLIQNQQPSILQNQQQSLIQNQSQGLLHNQQQVLPFQRTQINSNSTQQQQPQTIQQLSQSIQQQPQSTQQPLSARRQLENRVSITDMSRIKTVHINNFNNNTNNTSSSFNNNNNTSYNNTNNNSLINNNNSFNYNRNNINSNNNSNNHNIASVAASNNFSNSVNSLSSNYSDQNNSVQPVSRIVRHDDLGRLFRQKFAEAEKIDMARKPLSEKSGNGTVSSGTGKPVAYKSFMDQLSEIAAANGMNDNNGTTSILLSSRMLTQIGKR